MRQVLGQWLRKPDLARFRTESVLDGLAPEDKAAWTSLWDRVEAAAK